MTLASCSSSQAEVLRNQIRVRLSNGETREEIVASLVERFGESVRGAPRNRGFARLAWLGPFVIVLVGIGMIMVYLRRYRSQPVTAGEAPARDPRVRARIEEELKARRT